MRHPFLCLVIALPLLAATNALAAPGPADPKSAESTKSRDHADDLFDKGKEAFNLGKIEDAYALYQAAWALKQTHDIAGNMAQAELKLGKKREAFEHITFAIAHFPPSSASDPRPAMEKVLAGLRQQLGLIHLELNVQGAKISIDGRALAASQSLDEVFVEPGTHTFVAELAGYATATATATATAGSPNDVKLTLVKEAPVGKTELPNQDLKPPPQPLSGGPSVPLIATGASLAGAAAITGIIFTVVANGKAGAADQQRQDLVHAHGGPACTGATVPPECGVLSTTTDARATMSNVAVWSFIGAGTLGAATAIYALTARKREPPRDTQIMPIVTGTTAGIAIGGVW